MAPTWYPTPAAFVAVAATATATTTTTTATATGISRVDSVPHGVRPRAMDLSGLQACMEEFNATNCLVRNVEPVFVTMMVILIVFAVLIVGVVIAYIVWSERRARRARRKADRKIKDFEQVAAMERLATASPWSGSTAHAVPGQRPWSSGLRDDRPSEAIEMESMLYDDSLQRPQRALFPDEATLRPDTPPAARRPLSSTVTRKPLPPYWCGS